MAVLNLARDPPARKPVSAEARGKWRQFRRHVSARYQRIERALFLPRTRTLMLSYPHRNAIGRARVIRQMTQILGTDIPLEERTNKCLGWSFLVAGTPPTIGNTARDPGLTQDCVCVYYVLLGGCVKGGVWTLEIPDHAGGRLLERDPKADPAAVIRAAHRNLLEADSDGLAAILMDVRKTFLLPAGNGWFVCHVIGVKADDGKSRLHFRARSWFHQDMAIDARIIARPGEPGEQMRDTILTLPPLEWDPTAVHETKLCA